MTTKTENDPQDISKDLFGSKLELKKIFQTFVQVIKNVKLVVDDFYFNNGNYTKPVKYALSVIAPYVIIIQLFNIDMAFYILEVSKQSGDAAAVIKENPDLAKFFTRFYEVNSIFVKIQYEFLPVVYAVFYIPIIAFWLKKFYKVKELKFSYYYALGTYIMMTVTAITLPLVLISIYGLMPLSMAMQISAIITLLFYTYGIFTTFNGGIVKCIFKTAFVIGLTLITVIIPMTVILMSITFFTM